MINTCVCVCVCVCVYMHHAHTEGFNEASSKHRVEFSTLGPFLSRASVDQRTNILYSIYLPTHHICPIQDIIRSASSREATEHHACVCVCVLTHFSRVQLFATPGTVAHKAPLFVGFSRQKYWSGLPCSRPVDLSDPGIEPSSALAGRLFTTNATWEATEHSGQGQNQSQTPVLGLDPSPIPYKPRQFKILPN